MVNGLIAAMARAEFLMRGRDVDAESPRRQML